MSFQYWLQNHNNPEMQFWTCPPTNRSSATDWFEKPDWVTMLGYRSVKSMLDGGDVLYAHRRRTWIFRQIIKDPDHVPEDALVALGSLTEGSPSRRLWCIACRCKPSWELVRMAKHALDNELDDPYNENDKERSEDE